MRQFFLGKNGRTLGPYSEQDISKLRASGDLQHYTWLWDTDHQKWEALDPPPPPVVFQEQQPTKQKEAPTTIVRHDSIIPIEVIAHDGVQAIAGGLRNIEDHRCLLESTTPASTPPFRIPSAVILSLFDAASGQSSNIKAQIQGAQKTSGAWHYELKWDRIPDLIQSALTR